MVEFKFDELYSLLKTAKLNDKQKVAITQNLVLLEKFPSKSRYTTIKSILVANQQKNEGGFLSSFRFFKRKPSENTVETEIPTIQFPNKICYQNLQKCPFDQIKVDYRKAFMMMQFNNEILDNFYNSVIKKNLNKMSIKCTRADERFDVPNALCKICKSIRESGILIADMTGMNPNVFCEIGMCFGLGRRVILLCQSEKDNPFDTKVIEHIRYDLNNVKDFKSNFSLFIEQAIKDESRIINISSSKIMPSEISSVDSKTFNEIYKPLYERITASLELIERNMFEGGARNNTIGDKVLNVITVLKRNIYWEKVDNLLKEKIQLLIEHYEEIFSIGSIAKYEILKSLNSKFELNGLEILDDQGNGVILESFDELTPFILKKYSELDEYRREKILTFISKFELNKKNLGVLNSEEFWISIKEQIHSLEVIKSYLEKRKGLEDLLNEIKQLLANYN